MKISSTYACCFLFVTMTYMLYGNVSSGQDVDARVVTADQFHFKHLTCPQRYSQKGKNVFRWTLEEQKDKPEMLEKHFWVVTRICMNNQERKVFKFPYEFNKKTIRRIDSNTNMVPSAILTVSPNGEFFIIRDINGKSMLVYSETGEEVVFPKARKSYYGGEETALGFGASGNLFCGTPCLSPMLLLREIDTKTLTVKEERMKAYRYRKMNYPPWIGLQPEYWLDEDTSYDNIGILYSVLPPPEENLYAGTIVLPFTTFQFHFLMAMILIYDTQSEFDCTQSLVDTTWWFRREKVFFWSIDSQYLAIHDGAQKIQIYNTKTRDISICDILTQAKESFAYIRKAWFLSNGEMVIVIAEKYRDIGLKSVMWSPKTREFRELFSTSTVLSASPKGDYIATATIKHRLGDDSFLSWNPEIDLADTIEFWSTKEMKKVHTLPLKFTSRVYFAPDWSLLELERFDFDKENQKMVTVSEVIELSNILPLQNFSIHQVREWNSMVGTKTNAKYISSTETAVKLEKEDGKIITVPLVKLSQEDQEYVKQLAEEDEKDK